MLSMFGWTAVLSAFLCCFLNPNYTFGFKIPPCSHISERTISNNINSGIADLSFDDSDWVSSKSRLWKCAHYKNGQDNIKKSKIMSLKSSVFSSLQSPQVNVTDNDNQIIMNKVSDSGEKQMEVYPFQAKVKRVLDIIINSLYTDKDVFLRELVSNAADACDKRKLLLQATKNTDFVGGIRIYPDKQSRTLTIEDNGIGMDKQELMDHLGTIARSGTLKFVEENMMKQTPDMPASSMQEKNTNNSLIGQFGVGFYSAFLVADRVQVISSRWYPDNDKNKTKTNQRQVWIWESSCDQNFSVTNGDIDSEDARYTRQVIELKKQIPNGLQDEVNFSAKLQDANPNEALSLSIPWTGTRIVLHLKPECDDYLEDYRIKELLKKYSEFLTIPIYLLSERVEYERVPVVENVQKTNQTEATAAKQVYKTVTHQFQEWIHTNTQPPIWRRDEKTLLEKDYVNFYKSTFKAYDDPLSFLHMSVEGQVSFRALLYVPGTLPWELSRNMFDESSKGLRLYVRRVFINDQFQEAVPRWLTFIRGIIDSDDLPLNVGREILQKSKMLRVIHKRIAAKAIDMITALKRQGGDKWMRFWDNYGKYLKVGAVEDRDNQESLASLVHFHSTQVSNQMTTLDEYIQRMEDRNRAIENGTFQQNESEKVKKQPLRQTAIYYITAESRQAALDSPALELLRAHGFEVLFGVEPLDEFFLASLNVNQYKGYQVLDANKADLKLNASNEAPIDTSGKSESDVKKLLDPTPTETRKIELSPLIEWVQQTLGPKVHNVILSDRLVNSPAILVQGDFGLSPTMQRYMKQQAAAQGVSEQELFGTSLSQPILELNPNHSIIYQLDSIVKSDPSSERAKALVQSIFDVASLQGGYSLVDSGQFARNIIDMMRREADGFLAK